ncbi:zinc finger CCCH domain-containing protein 28-like [Prunus dulcis]|uniref:zinc finger CCCH domain-containing protein 28-like n=1 Tax=Prunus dulcis TaxID=3755 RepID=UPI001482A40B|nr:zinc finger CCCH domain-containing protein 28-like [Prunus dulcis]
MSDSGPTCQFFTPYLESGDNKHQLKPEFPNADKDFKDLSDIESQPFKKPRTSEVVLISTIPTAQNKMLHCNFKTRLCNNFKMGNCHYRRGCCFAHGISDLRKTWRNWQGLETEEGFKARTCDHRRTSNDVCRLFFNGGKCTYGDKCRYPHHVTPENIREKSAISISTTGAHIGGSGQFYRKRSLELMKLCGYMAVESGSVQNSRTSSTSMSKRRMGIGATYHKQVQGRECDFKWNELEKMSRIYADWIEDIPLVHGSSSKAEC